MATTQSVQGPAQFQGMFDVIVFKESDATLTAVAAAETELDLTVVGAAVGDLVLVAVEEDTEGGTLSGSVTAADTVTVVFSNQTAGTITIPTLTVLNGVVLKPKGPFDAL